MPRGLTDVDCTVGNAPYLTASNDHGFVIDEAEVIYWGLCPACSTAPVLTPAPEPGRIPMSDSPDAVVGEMNEESERQCPVAAPPTHPTEGTANRDWWPNQLNLSVLHQNPAMADPMGADFDYAAEFETLDLEAREAGHRSR